MSPTTTRLLLSLLALAFALVGLTIAAAGVGALVSATPAGARLGITVPDAPLLGCSGLVVGAALTALSLYALLAELGRPAEP